MTFAAQQPIGTGFGPRTTAAEVIAGIDLSGRTALVTGGYSGLGLETTRVLSGAGATVVVPARTPEKARAALAGLPNVEQAEIELTDPASIDRFAEGFLASGRPLDILVDSAGIMASPLTRDGRGYEQQFSANHLGHFQLAARLWPALVAANGARVVSVSSRGHRFAAVDFDDPNFATRAYDKWLAYGQSKTANVLFAVELDRRAAGHAVRAFALHPGAIITDLARHLTDEDLARFGVVRRADGSLDLTGFEANWVDAKTVEQGAATSVFAATSPKLDGLGGLYLENCDVAGPASGPDMGRVGVEAWAVDPDAARRLWNLSERLTGVSFPAGA